MKTILFALRVSDLERSLAFYRSPVGLEPVYRSGRTLSL